MAALNRTTPVSRRHAFSLMSRFGAAIPLATANTESLQDFARDLLALADQRAYERQGMRRLFMDLVEAKRACNVLEVLVEESDDDPRWLAACQVLWGCETAIAHAETSRLEDFVIKWIVAMLVERPTIPKGDKPFGLVMPSMARANRRDDLAFHHSLVRSAFAAAPWLGDHVELIECDSWFM